MEVDHQRGGALRDRNCCRFRDSPTPAADPLRQRMPAAGVRKPEKRLKPW